MSARDPAAQRRRVLLCGYYGEHNLGDDALLTVLLSQLPPGWQPVVTAHDQQQVRRRFAAVVPPAHGALPDPPDAPAERHDRRDTGREASRSKRLPDAGAPPSTAAQPSMATVDRRSLRQVLAALADCQALVLGGGSLLQDSTSFRSLLYYGALILAARGRGRPVLLWGQGLGPLRRRRSRLLARLLLRLASGISWRDADSARLAAGWGIHAAQGSDPVWALAPLPWQGAGGPIVLCWRPVRQLDDRGWRLLLTALEQLAERCDRPVHWLPFHQEQDTGLLADLQRRGLVSEALQRRSVQLEAATPEQAMQLFQGASLVLAMRLHGLILAALAGSPCAALSYDPKVAAAAEALGCPCLELGDLAEAEAAGATEAASASERLAASWQPLVDHPADPARRERLRAATRVHTDLLQQLAVSPPGA